MNKLPPAPGATAQPLAAHRPGTPRPSSQQDGARGYLDLCPRDRETSRSRGLGSTPGTPHAMAPGTRLVSPPQAWLPCRMPHGLAPGAAPAGHRGMNREKGQGCASTILPLAKTPSSHSPLGAPQGSRGRRGAVPGCVRERGQRHSCVPAFLPQPRHGVAGVPPWPHSASHLLRLSPGPARRSGSQCRRHQTRSAPSSLLPASSESNAEGRSRLHAPGANGQGTKNLTEIKMKQGKKKNRKKNSDKGKNH